MSVVMFLLMACLPLGRTARLEADMMAALEPASEKLESRTEPRSPAEPQWSPPSAWLEEYEAEAQLRLQKKPKVQFPATLTIDYQVNSYLGAGSFGESWLVTVADRGSSIYKQQVVVKLLYVTDDHGRDKHLSWRMAKADAWSLKAAKEAARECEIAADLHEQGEQAGMRGVEHIMNCYGHNIPDHHTDVRRRMDTPLFLVLQNCGGEDLTKFMNRKASENKLSVELVGGLFRQILGGLDFLASLTVPWIHHDLKGDNIVVKSHGNGQYSAYLIDLGATVKGTKAFRCKFTASTKSIAPSEWGVYDSSRCPQVNFYWSTGCPSCSTNFDMYSAAAVLFEMVIGSRLYHMKNALALGGKSFAYNKIDGYAKNPATISTKVVAPGGVDQGTSYNAYLALMQAFLEQGSASEAFFDATMAGLSSLAANRPTAAQLLQHEFFAPLEISVQEPVIPVQEPVKTVEHLVHKPEAVLPMQKPMLPAQTPQTPASPLGGCRFSVGEVIEVYHFVLNMYVEGTVRKLSDTSFLVTVDIKEMVQVKGAKPGTMAPQTTTYVRPCMSSLLRKIEKVQEEIIYPTGGFRPAMGKHMPNFDDVSRATEDSSCPELCMNCDTYPSLSAGQFVCWSPTLLNSGAATQWLHENGCETTDTYSKTKFGRSYYGYVCNK